jgi:tetratricopeptide (TPR) repeat protein
VLERDEDGERALALASRAIRTYLELADLFPETVDYRHRLAIARSHAALAIVLIETRKRAESDTADQAQLSSAVDVPDDAKMLFDGAIEGLRTLQTEHPDVPDYRYSLGHILYRYGLLVATAGQPDIARDLFGQSIDLWRPLSEAGHAESADYLALLLATCPVSDLRNPADALSASTLATSASPSNLRYQLTHAVSLALNGDFTASEAAISSIRSARGNLAPRDHWGQAILAKLANTDNFTQHRIQAESALMAHPGCPRMLAFQELLNQLEQKSD